jgi:hypothetical protein
LVVDSTEREDIPPFGGNIDYLTFGGIYRPVALRLVPDTYIDDVFAKPIDVLTEQPRVEVRCTLERPNAPALTLTAELRDGQKVLASGDRVVSVEEDETLQFAESVVAELHRAFVGATGEFRAGPVHPDFESLIAELAGKTDPAEQPEVTQQIERLVRDESLVLSLCAPQALYAVNGHVDLTPHRISFELAETSVEEGHWSRR